MTSTDRVRILSFGLVTATVAACGGGMYKASGGRSADMAAESPAAAPPVMAASGVRAGEWDDNANYREFQKLIASHAGMVHDLDIRDRQFVVVRDAAGRAVPSCRVAVRAGDDRVVRLTTLANGRAILFPRAAGIDRPEVVVSASCRGQTASARTQLTEGEGVIELSLRAARSLPARPRLDIAFVLDSTGSMSEEISGVKATIAAVAAELESFGADIRVGLVEYKDRTDSFVTRVFPLTGDIVDFARRVDRVSASGGGDTPESVNEGLRVAVTQLAWDPRATARIAFLIGDAPPHLDYANDVTYARTVRHAARRGVQIHTIAASGMDLVGQLVFRQIAQFTGGTNMFVLRGGAGPRSTGAGDPASSCGGTQESYTSGNLDALVVSKVRAAIAAVDGDPMRIPGLGQDERAKPCGERVIATE